MTVLNIKEMSCEHCVQRIGKMLDALNMKYEINLSSKTVSIDGDEACVEKVIEELDDIGFTAQR